MIPLKKALTSSIGKKYVMGVTGLSLVGFVTTHLLANLTLYFPDPVLFNTYPAKLHAWGPGLYVAEIALAGLFVVHIAMALWIQQDKRAAEGEYGVARRSKGGNSRFGATSVNMIITGGFLGIALVAHIIHFRFGAGIEAGYVTTIDGEQARDLHRLVAEQFRDPVIAGLYSITMLALGMHLRHGFWSAFQSLGLMKPEWSDKIHALGAIIAILFTVGFFFIPIWFYFDIPGSL